MLSECENDPDDAMHRTLDEIQSALNAGEEVRVVLAGSLCGGTGAAGIESVAALLQNRFGQNDNFRMAAVLMLPCADGESPARAQAALERISIENALQTVCLIGLPQSAQSSGGNDLPRLTDWLGAYCMDVLLHRPTWLTGTFTVQTADGAANWKLFGKGDERYRVAFGGLLKGALLWQRKILPTLEKRLAKGNALKSGWIGWYPHYFRGAAEDIEDVRADAQAVDRLTQVALLYLAGIIRSLPLDSALCVRAGNGAGAGQGALRHADSPRRGTGCSALTMPSRTECRRTTTSTAKTPTPTRKPARRWNALRGWRRAYRTRTPCRKRSTGKWAVRRQ